MGNTIVYFSEFILITKRENEFFIESFKKGLTVEQFNRIIGEHPEISLTSFIAIKNALLSAPTLPTKFAETRERVSISISSDELKAYVTLSVLESEIVGEKSSELIKEIVGKLSKLGITYGLKKDVIFNQLRNNEKVLVAEGTLPENGEDSLIKMFELKEPKPETKEDGNVNHYELNLISAVKEGDWLGERAQPSEGKLGKSVKGNEILPVAGKSQPILYDKNSVREVNENGLTVLYARRNGAVNYHGDKIGVSNLLEIPNNVDFKTGNVDFNGYLSVKGSIEDNFSVIANKDIEVLGEYGVGSVREIVSREGSIYIKGGIAGKSKAIIRSKKDVYTKFISDASIICDGSVHIGFYCLNSKIIAKEVILDSPKGQIIGGQINAEIKVVASIIGSASEKKTNISVKGFDRKVLRQRLENTMGSIDIIRRKLAICKNEIAMYTNISKMSIERQAIYEELKNRFSSFRSELKALDDEKKILINYLRTHGEGEVVILKKVYPGTLIEIKKIVKDITSTVQCTSFYVQDGEMKEI